MSVLYWPWVEVRCAVLCNGIILDATGAAYVRWNYTLTNIYVTFPSLFHTHTFTATLGNALTYLYPAMMYSSMVKKQNRKDQGTAVFIANCSAVLGVVMGVIGTFQ